ncbi:hypothetical protein ECEC1864_2393, partial [Escherichia coli EC1864]
MAGSISSAVASRPSC